VPTAAGFLYLAVVLDTWSRKIVGWSMANHLRTDLVLGAMAMAITTATKAASTRQWHSASAAARPAFAPRWDRSVMPMTTPWPRVSSPPLGALHRKGHSAQKLLNLHKKGSTNTSLRAPPKA